MSLKSFLVKDFQIRILFPWQNTFLLLSLSSNIDDGLVTTALCLQGNRKCVFSLGAHDGGQSDIFITLPVPVWWRRCPWHCGQQQWRRKETATAPYLTTSAKWEPLLLLFLLLTSKWFTFHFQLQNPQKKRTKFPLMNQLKNIRWTRFLATAQRAELLLDTNGMLAKQFWLLFHTHLSRHYRMRWEGNEYLVGWV